MLENLTDEQRVVIAEFLLEVGERELGEAGIHTVDLVGNLFYHMLFEDLKDEATAAKFQAIYDGLDEWGDEEE
jgi:hypothetical protein